MPDSLSAPSLLASTSPRILFSIGQGAVIPIIPLFARELGASLAAAAPDRRHARHRPARLRHAGGRRRLKWGDKGAMVAGTALIALVAVGAAFSPSPVVLASSSSSWAAAGRSGSSPASPTSAR